MQSAVRRRCSRQPFPNSKLMNLAALYTRGFNPTLRSRASASLPVQKAQNTDRTSYLVRVMAFGINPHLIRPSLVLEYPQRNAENGFSIRGGFSTKFEKVFERKLLAECANRERVLQDSTEQSIGKCSNVVEDLRPGVIYSFEESDATNLSEGFSSRRTLETAESSLRSADAMQAAAAASCTEGLGSTSSRPWTSRTSSEHKLRAVSSCDVETAVTEGDWLPRESDVWDRAVKLRQVIADYSYRYHTLNNPVISDAAYDALVRELKDLESDLPTEASIESVSAKVGAPPSLDIAKVRHAVPMLSLAAVYKEDQLRAWHERLQQRLNKLSNGGQTFIGAWVVEPKVDGLALTLRYEKGRLACAATRGDGSEGEDVTYNARNLTGIPEVLPELLEGINLHESVMEVRGEVYMALNDFQELNEIKVKAGEKPFANPRNAAAGSIRILKNRDSDDRRLSFMAYTVVSSEDTVAAGMETLPHLVNTQWDALNLLKQMGFSVNDDNRKFDSFEGALAFATRWRDSRLSLKYESDGVVFKANELAVQAELGAVGSDPRWAVAWKFAATEVVTVLEGIELTIGRSGAIIPNARLKPVELGGITISRASLHNFGMVEKLGICEGDHVVVQRAGDVIPQVVQVLRALRPDHLHVWVPPEFCPSCDAKLIMCKEKKIASCGNDKCPGRHSRKIEHFAKTLFKGMGPAILVDLQDAGMLADPADFFGLDPVALSHLDGLGKKSATKLIKAIEECKSKPLSELITALGIPTVGTSAAKLLEKWFGSMDRLIAASKEELQLVPGVGTVSAAAIQDWCMNPFNVQLVSRIKEAGFAPTFSDPEIEKHALATAVSTSALQVTSSKSRTSKSGKLPSKERESVESVSSLPIGDVFESEDPRENVEEPPLQGKSVVITGEFEEYGRDELQLRVIQNGGQVRKSVSSKTSFIVAGKFPGPSKMAKAAQLQIPVHNLSSFQQLLDRGSRRDNHLLSSSLSDFKQAMSG